MSSSIGRGRGRGASRQNGPSSVSTGVRSTASNADSTQSAQTATSRRVLEAAAATVKEFVPRNMSLPPTAVNAEVFVPRLPAAAAAAAPVTASATCSAPGSWATGQPGDSYTGPARRGDGGASNFADSSFETYPESQLGSTPQETEALHQIEQLVNRLLSEPFCLESELDRIVGTLNRSIVSEQAMQMLCSYLIQTGWAFNTFSYIGSRLVHLLDVKLAKNGVLGNFRSVFLRLLKCSYDEIGNAAADPSMLSEWLNFSIFFAEIYRNVIIFQPSSQHPGPIKALSVPLLEAVRNLMLQPSDDTMQCACFMLKLTGSYLQSDARELLFQCTEGLRVIPKHGLSQRTCTLIDSVLRLQSQNWGSSPGAHIPQSPIFIPTADPLAAMQSDAMPYEAVASARAPYATGYSQQQQSDPVEAVTNAIASSSLQPVTNKDMWSEYADPEDEYEDEDDLALQRDMEEEYARFLRETEDS